MSKDKLLKLPKVSNGSKTTSYYVINDPLPPKLIVRRTYNAF